MKDKFNKGEIGIGFQNIEELREFASKTLDYLWEKHGDELVIFRENGELMYDNIENTLMDVYDYHEIVGKYEYH